MRIHSLNLTLAFTAYTAFTLLLPTLPAQADTLQVPKPHAPTQWERFRATYGTPIRTHASEILGYMYVDTAEGNLLICTYDYKACDSVYGPGNRPHKN